jgi:hypothetical protein
MKTRNIVLASVAVLFCTASACATTIAHTWVSGSGSDTNPCTFASPCLTFGGALANTSAYGIITVKDAGDFGAVTISKSVTIDGSNLGSIISTSTNAIWIYNTVTEPINVVLRNLTLNGMVTGETGVWTTGAANVTIVNCLFENFISNGIGTYNNAAENFVVRDTVIVGGNYGFSSFLGSSPAFYASLQNVTIMGAEEYAVYNAIGVMEITGSVLTQSITGVAAGNGATISVASSMITANNTGVYSETGAKIRLDNNDIYDNTTAIGNGGGIVKTSTTNKVSGVIAIPAADISNSVTF